MSGNEVSTADKIKELKAELMWRHRVYARSIKAGRMKPALAQKKISILNAIIADYERGADLFSPFK